MRLSKTCLALLITLSGGWFAACSPLGHGCLLCGDLGPYDVSGQVFDDNGNLPPGAQNRQPVEGVKVEVIDGVEQGRFAVTDVVGRFNLGKIDYLGRVRASKDGWESAENWFICCGLPLDLVIGQAPHTVWGWVTLADRTPVRGVRVAIVTGPASGGVAFTDDRGYYRLDGLATQPGFAIEFSMAGYRTGRFEQVTSGSSATLHSNVRTDWTLTPE